MIELTKNALHLFPTRIFIIFMLFGGIFQSNSISAQGWEQVYSEGVINSGESLQKTADGGGIILGHSRETSDSNANVLLIKVDNNGTEEWSQTLGSVGSEDFGLFVQQTADGGYIITGKTHLEGCNGEDGGWNILLIKTYPNGLPQWTKILGGSLNDVGWSVCQTTDGGYAIAGYTVTGWWDVEGDFKEVYLVKTDEDGNEEWSQTFGDEEMTAIGHSVEQTSDGGFIIGGRIGPGRKIQNNTTSDAYLLKTDESGLELWSQTYGGAYFDGAYSVQQTTDGGFIFSGLFTGANGLSDVYLVKTNANGNEEWSQIYGNNDAQSYGRSVLQTADGGYIIGGTGDNDMILIKVTEMGEQEWLQNFGTADTTEACNAAVQSNDGCYFILGTIGTTWGNDGQSEAYLVKTCGETGSSINVLHAPSKKLDRIIDLRGRLVEPSVNQILLYIYDDGSVERRCIVE